MPESYVELHTTETTAEAELLRSALVANGVRVHLSRADERESLGFLAVDRGMKILVDADNAERARALLEDFHARAEGADEDFDAEEADELATALVPTFKQYRVAFICAFGLAWGFLHLYAGRRQTGRALVTLSAVSFILLLAGSPFGMALPYLYFIDLLGGTYWIWRYNRAVRRSLETQSALPGGTPYRNANGALPAPLE